MRLNLHGVITALVTPFHKGEVDLRSFRRLLSRQLNDGVAGVVVNGTTGESPTLSYEEVESLLAVARDEIGDQIPIILGTGSNCTRKTIELTQSASRWGADAALVVTPYYNKPPQRGLVEHFRAVADASALPIILYNVPGRTITNIEVETVAALSQHPRIVGIKEASGNLGILRQLKAAVPHDFALLSGDDATAVQFCREGGHGVISVISHLVAREMSDCIARARSGDRSAEEEWLGRQGELLKLIYVESNPIPIKAALYLCEVIDSPELRLPLVALADEHMASLRDELRRQAKIGE